MKRRSFIKSIAAIFAASQVPNVLAKPDDKFIDMMEASKLNKSPFDNKDIHDLIMKSNAVLREMPTPDNASIWNVQWGGADISIIEAIDRAKG
jgi:hypothetical protein